MPKGCLAGWVGNEVIFFCKNTKALYLQVSLLSCANIVKKDPGRARQNSLAKAGINFIKPVKLMYGVRFMMHPGKFAVLKPLN